MTTVHPKTSAAALFGALGIVICGILHSIHGVHLAPELYGSIVTFLSTLGAFLAPSPPSPGATALTPSPARGAPAPDDNPTAPTAP